MKTISKQNSKLAKSSVDDEVVFGLGIPAIITCRNPQICAGTCYSLKFQKMYPNVLKSQTATLELTKKQNFVPLMNSELMFLKFKYENKKIYYRIHTDGDFYDIEYIKKWFNICKNNKDIQFYCYTKMVKIFKCLKNEIPDNLTVVFSYGGKEDCLINPKTDRHALVFANEQEIQDHGYTNASDNDLIAADKEIKCIGLKYHHQRSWLKSGWNKTSQYISLKEQNV